MTINFLEKITKHIGDKDSGAKKIERSDNSGNIFDDALKLYYPLNAALGNTKQTNSESTNKLLETLAVIDKARQERNLAVASGDAEKQKQTMVSENELFLGTFMARLYQNLRTFEKDKSAWDTLPTVIYYNLDGQEQIKGKRLIKQLVSGMTKELEKIVARQLSEMNVSDKIM